MIQPTCKSCGTLLERHDLSALRECSRRQREVAEADCLVRELSSSPIRQATRFVPVRDVAELVAGDVIRNVVSDLGYVITATHGTRATAVRTMDVTDPIEWLVYRP